MDIESEGDLTSCNNLNDLIKNLSEIEEEFNNIIHNYMNRTQIRTICETGNSLLTKFDIKRELTCRMLDRDKENLYRIVSNVKNKIETICIGPYINSYFQDSKSVFLISNWEDTYYFLLNLNIKKKEIDELLYSMDKRTKDDWSFILNRIDPIFKNFSEDYIKRVDLLDKGHL